MSVTNSILVQNSTGKYRLNQKIQSGRIAFLFSLFGLITFERKR